MYWILYLFVKLCISSSFFSVSYIIAWFSCRFLGPGRISSERRMIAASNPDLCITKVSSSYRSLGADILGRSVFFFGIIIHHGRSDCRVHLASIGVYRIFQCKPVIWFCNIFSVGFKCWKRDFTVKLNKEVFTLGFQCI